MEIIENLSSRLSFRFGLLKYALSYMRHALRCKALELTHPGYLKKVRKADIEPVFIVGAGRSGNTLLARLLHETGGVHFGPENFTLCATYLKYLQCIDAPWEERVERILSILMSQEDVGRWEKVDVSAVRKHLFASDEHTLGNIIHVWYLYYGRGIDYPSERWGCKTPNLTPFMTDFLKIFPSSKVLHIVREPRDVIVSFSKAGIRPYDNPLLAELLWYYYNKRMNEVAKSACCIFRVIYEQLAKNPDDVLRQISEISFPLPTGTKVVCNNPDVQQQHLEKVSGEIKYYTYNSDVIINPRTEKLYHELLA